MNAAKSLSYAIGLALFARRLSFLERLLIAVFVVALGVSARFLFSGVFSVGQQPYITFFPTIVIISLLCGPWISLASVMTLVFIAKFYFLPPKTPIFAFSTANLVSLAVFMGTSLTIALVVESMHRAHIAVVDLERRLREQCADAAARLQAVLDALPVGVAYSDDLACRNIIPNPVLRRQLDVSEGNLSASAPDPSAPGRQIRYFSEGREIADRELPLRRAIAEQRVIPPADYDVLFPDGRRWTFEGSAAPILSPAGRLVAGVAVAVDVAERRRMERALQEEDRRKDEFLATLAHELRNPLAAIQNANFAVKSGASEATVARANAIIERQLGLLIRLIDDLLDISRIKMKKIELRTGRIDLARVIEESIDMMDGALRSKDQKLARRVPQDGGFVVEGDRARLMQLFANLLDNARKFTPAAGKITVSLTKDDTHAVASISDEGCGIAPEHLNSIFNLFHQVSEGSANARQGMGIGLSLVQELVALHGGDVEAYSAGPGLGSEFIVRLPLAPASAARA